PQRRGSLGQRRNRVGDQLLDLVQARSRQCVRDITIGRRGANRETVVAPLDDRVFVLLVDAPVNDRILRRQFQFAHLAVTIDSVTGLELLRTEMRLPLPREFLKPKLERLWGVDALGTVRLHPAKGGTVEPGWGWANLISCQLPEPLAMRQLYVNLLPHARDRALVFLLPLACAFAHPCARWGIGKQ